jgi:hypothetical protein
MKKNDLLGFYSGFLLFGLQIVGNDIYRDYKTKKSNEKIKLLFKKYNI